MEILRRELTHDEKPCLDVACPRCGREIRLWWNGGELDGATCCGLTFILEHVRTDLVIADGPRE